MAALAVQAVFTVAGYYFGGPIGGAIGSAAGAYVGNMLFPPKYPSQPAQDLRLQTASNGAPIPIIYGSSRTEAIIVDGSDRFTRHEGDSGGKGGPSGPTPDTYSIGVMRIVWCESAGDRHAGREWHNGRIVADSRVGAAEPGELPEVFYDGAPDQPADPTEEAVFGVGNRSAYRYLASSVYTDLNLGEYGNMLPNIHREIIQGEAHVDKPLETVTYNNNEDSPAGHQWPAPGSFEGNAPAITQWDADAIRVRDVANTRVYTYDPVTLSNTGFDTAADDWPTAVLNGNGDGAYMPVGHYRYRGSGVRVQLWGTVEELLADGTSLSGNPAIYGPPIASVQPTIELSPNGFYVVGNILAGSGVDPTDQFMSCCTTEDETALFVFVVTAAQRGIAAGKVDKWYMLVDGLVADSGTVPDKPSGFQFLGSTTRNGPTLCAMFENDRKTCWVGVGNGGPSLGVSVINDDNEFVPAAVHFTAEPAHTLTMPEGSHGLCWTAIRTLEGGCKCGVIADQAAWLVERCTITDGFVRLSDIVDDQHVRAGDADGTYDTSELIDIVRGLRVKTPASPRGVIESLQDLYGFAPVDSQGVVKYVKLGKPSILFIPDEDLCAHDENGSDIPSPLQVVLGNDIELPAQIYLSYLDYNAQYQLGVQNWHRQHTASKIVRQIGLDITLVAKEAKQMVDAIGERTLREADKYTFYLLRKAARDVDGNLIAYAQLEPTDVVTVKGIDLRIVNRVENQATGILKFEAVRSHPGVVIQTGAGGGESEGIPDPEIPTPQDTELVLGDYPYIPDESRQGVITVGVRGALRSTFRGASVQEAPDGTNYHEVLRTTVPAGIGEALTVLPPYGGGNTFDESSFVDILMHTGGTLESYTRKQTMAGIRPYMVGAEMIFARSAELVDTDTYRLTGLLRGRKGTKWAIRGHAIGDKFMDLKSAQQIDALFGEYGITIPYKAVTIGRSLATATAVPFLSAGVSRAPFAPVHVGVGRDGSGNIIIQWVRCARIHSEWVDFAGVPLDEEVEKYRVQIFTDGSFQTVKRSIIVVAGAEFDETVIPYGTFAPNNPRAMYTAADQTTDFGGLVDYDVPLTIQQWGMTGWGYDTLGRLPPIVPVTTGGYVPPNPPPADGIMTVMPWGPPAVRQFSGAMGRNDQWHIRVNSGGTSSGALVRLSGAEWLSDGGAPCTHEWCFSPIRGDFTAAYAGATAGSKGAAVTVNAGFAVGSGPATFSGFTYPTMPLNSEWWLNIRHGATTYDNLAMFMDLINSPGP